ncbi:MAG: hypothetical protein WBA24_07060, partial [Geitlerinemataceae cyanobacterium]
VYHISPVIHPDAQRLAARPWVSYFRLPLERGASDRVANSPRRILSRTTLYWRNGDRFSHFSQSESNSRSDCKCRSVIDKLMVMLPKSRSLTPKAMGNGL